MVSSVSNNNGNVTSLARAQPLKNVTPPKSFTDGLVGAKNASQAKPASNVTITLGDAQQNPNLPRGSIVDRLV